MPWSVLKTGRPAHRSRAFRSSSCQCLEQVPEQVCHRREACLPTAHAGVRHRPTAGADHLLHQPTRQAWSDRGRRLRERDVRLPVQRLMIGILLYQHMRQQTRAGQATIDGTCWRRRLHDAVAGHAAQLRPYVADHLKGSPYVLQDLGCVFAKLAEPAPAIGAGLMSRGVRMDLTRQMLGQRTAERLCLRRLVSRDNCPIASEACDSSSCNSNCSICRRTFSLFTPKSIR